MEYAPKYVFIDTNIFDSQNYNYQSASFKAFQNQARSNKITLLLPYPAELEINRHIRERSAEAARLIKAAQKRVPFFEVKIALQNTAISVVQNLENEGIKKLERFFNHFKTEKLDSNGVDANQVMRRYDRCLPPFGKGIKRNEFSDAFSVAILENFAEKLDCTIAIISQDQDIKLACEDQKRLLYFQSLSIYTQSLTGVDDKWISDFISSIFDNPEPLASAIQVEADDVDVVHAHGEYQVSKWELGDVELENIWIVELGSHDCTVAFEATIPATLTLSWDEWDERYNVDVYVDGIVSDQLSLGGIAKVRLDKSRNKSTSVSFVELDSDVLTATSISHDAL